TSNTKYMDINFSDETKQKLLDYLLDFVSENKKNLFEKIIRDRTRYITVVLEDIFQPHNASAVLRTCDCFGIQDVHIIENNNQYEINPDVALGSSKWLNLIKYNKNKHNTLEAFEKLKEQGYRIVATTPHKNACTLEELNIDSKIALVFGTELAGLSDIAIENADEFVKIPMYGFTESFNISVSAAIILHYLTDKLRKSEKTRKLKKDEIIEIKLDWARSVVKRFDFLEKKFINNL
ncbi:MAG: RNA methyltransferase, partial [Bacteroidales bacterium]|nr:RNA methyltransferase [Bacteroidales bacterium]